MPPVNLGPGGGAVAITAGASHTCVILDDGAVRCWGNGSQGRLGYGGSTPSATTRRPPAVAPVNLGRAGRPAPSPPATSTPARSSTTARCAAGASAASGQLGNGATADVGDNESPAARASWRCRRAASARAVAGGAGHTCAILDDGSVSCWGFGANGRLGYGNTTSAPRPAGRSRSARGARRRHRGRRRPHLRHPRHRRRPLLGLRRPAAAWGTRPRPRSATPRSPPRTPRAGRRRRRPRRAGHHGRRRPHPGHARRSPTTGTGYTCALLDDGTMRCWGYGGDGRLGYGDESQVGGDRRALARRQGRRCRSGRSRARSATPRSGSPPAPRRSRSAAPSVCRRDGAQRRPRRRGPRVSIPPVAGLTYTAAAPSQGGFDPGSGRWEVGALAPGASAVLQLSARRARPART